jgi:hypothetical protein
VLLTRLKFARLSIGAEIIMLETSIFTGIMHKVMYAPLLSFTFPSSLLPYCQFIHLCSSLTFSPMNKATERNELKLFRVEQVVQKHRPVLRNFYLSNRGRKYKKKTAGCYDSARRKCIIKLLERKVAMSKKCRAQRHLRPTQRSTTTVHRLPL